MALHSMNATGGTLPPQYRSIMVKVRLSKLPSPLARSLLMRPIRASLRENLHPDQTALLAVRKITKWQSSFRIRRSCIGVDDVASTLGHLLAIDRPPAMGKDRFRKFQSERHNMVDQ